MTSFDRVRSLAQALGAKDERIYEEIDSRGDHVVWVFDPWGTCEFGVHHVDAGRAILALENKLARKIERELSLIRIQRADLDQREARLRTAYAGGALKEE